MDADLGRVLRMLKQEDPDASNYGFLPYMATHSRGSVGRARQLRCEPHSDEEQHPPHRGGDQHVHGAACTLHMNRSFMEFMRKYHLDAAKQRFKMTVNSGEEGEETLRFLIRQASHFSVEFIINFLTQCQVVFRSVQLKE